jgi:hypothetical protein
MTQKTKPNGQETDSFLSAENHVSEFDSLTEKGTRYLVHKTTRRSFLTRLGKVILAAVAGGTLPLLPVDRQVEIVEAADPNCNKWWMCGAYVDRTCSCACGTGGCPSGTTTGSAWYSCCYDPSISYGRLISYYDCCGSSLPSCCSNSGCECYNGSPAIWCGSAGSLCCTRVVINWGAYCSP